MLETKIYCNEMPRPIGFENVTIYRGLNAYYGKSTFDSIFNAFIDLIDNPMKQVCCSTHTIGDIGVVLEGDVIMASNMDLQSKMDEETNRRYYIPDGIREEHIIYDAKDLEDNNYGINDEIIMENVKVKAIWLSYSCDDLSLFVAEHISKVYGLKIIDVRQDF
jgi:hypothetical protein